MTQALDPGVLVEHTDGALWITLNRPSALNAMGKAVRVGLIETLNGIAQDPSVRAVVIQGSPRAFSAGGDIKEMGGGPESAIEMLQESGRVIELIEALPKPVVAAVRGHAAGAGMSLAIACDLVFAETTAVFTPSFILRGLAPDMSGTYYLVRQVGLLAAKKLILRGQAIDAREAFALGLVTEVWEPSEYEANLREQVEHLATGPTLGYAGAKRLLNASWHNDLPTQLQRELDEQVALTQTADHRESVVAFSERRTPRFRGA